MAITDEEHDHIIDKVRGILGEHFHSYMFIISDEEGDLFYDYTNQRVGRMLLNEAAADMATKPQDTCWEEESVEEESEEEDE